MAKKEEYTKKELRQHIYDTPDTYAGGSDLISEILPIYTNEKIEFKEIEYIPVLYNIFNEILVNSRDQIIRLEGVKGASQVSHIGWVKKTIGTGGRAGRVHYETLVAASSISGDSEDLVTPDE